MKKALSIIAIVTTLLIPSLAQAKSITLTTLLGEYSGKAAYVAIYLTNAEGKYEQTLWVAGSKTRYYRALRGWAQGSGIKSSEYDGKTGATIASNGTSSIELDLNDALIDAGYQIHIDVAAEGNRPSRDDIVIELTTDNAGQAVKGANYIRSFDYKF